MIRFSERNKIFITILFALCLTVLSPCVQAQEDGSPQKVLNITQAAMCEEIKGYEPQNSAVVFSIAIGKVFCFTAFDSVPRNMYIYHSWYRRDRLITTRRLSLKTPDWSTYSTIQLREADKGPWRVEIKDDSGQVLKVMRFSIAE